MLTNTANIPVPLHIVKRISNKKKPEEGIAPSGDSHSNNFVPYKPELILNSTNFF